MCQLTELCDMTCASKRLYKLQVQVVLRLYMIYIYGNAEFVSTTTRRRRRQVFCRQRQIRERVIMYRLFHSRSAHVRVIKETNSEVLAGAPTFMEFSYRATIGNSLIDRAQVRVAPLRCVSNDASHRPTPRYERGIIYRR